MQEPLLKFKNITVIKGGRKILKNISLSISEGENVAILGPNGAGKSSFIKLITREYYPTANKNSVFQIWGENRWVISKLRDLLGIVSNDLQHTYMRHICAQDVIFSGFFSSIGIDQNIITVKMKRKVQKVMKLLKISRLKNRMFDEMSSGEARLFLIGRALVHEPKALILDEPLTSLDLHAANKFCQILSKITNTKTAIILVTHRLQDIIPQITRVILMQKGQVYKDGPKEKILTTKNISTLFKTKLQVKKTSGIYYAPGY